MVHPAAREVAVAGLPRLCVGVGGGDEVRVMVCMVGLEAGEPCSVVVAEIMALYLLARA